MPCKKLPPLIITCKGLESPEKKNNILKPAKPDCDYHLNKRLGTTGLKVFNK